MKSQSYWEKRSVTRSLEYEKNSEQTMEQLINYYDKSAKDIKKEMIKIFNKYATDGKMTKQEAKTMLNVKESKEYYDNLLKQINTISDTDIKRKLLSKYNAPAYNYRIGRLKALQENIYIEIKKLADVELKKNTILYTDTIHDAYYKSIFDIQQGTGLGFSFAKIDTNTVKTLLNQPFLGSNYSKRIWANTDNLAEQLNSIIGSGFLTGASIPKMTNQLMERFDVGKFNATRLIRTEVNYYANQAELLSYEECELKKYKYIATLDTHTCGKCAKLDGQVFLVKDAQVGINCPPIHSFDRCTTVAHFEDTDYSKLTRRARDENGKSITVPSNMTYNEWYKKYVDNTLQNTSKSDTITKNIDGVKDVQYIGKLDKEKLGKYKNHIKTNKVVLTDERKQHILEKHKEDFELYSGKIKDIIKNPMYILNDIKNENTIFMIDKIDNSNLNVIIKLNVLNEKEHPQNSIMTLWRVRDKNLKKLIERNETIYKRE